MLKYKKSGFSLAEVLLTLSVIGIIAAVTIPAVFYDTSKDKLTAGLMKAYRELDNATKQIINETGEESLVNVFNNATVMRDKYKNVMSVSKTCTTAVGSCWPSSWKTLGGRNGSTIVAEPGAILADGSCLAFRVDDKACDNAFYKINGNNAQCGWIAVDINCASGPNMFGRDIQFFKIAKDGLHPGGASNDQWATPTNVYCDPANATDGNNGKGCAARVIKDGTMNY